jgi:hypothetical protein
VISPYLSMTIATLFATGFVDVHSTTDCPSTSDIVDRLVPLLSVEIPADSSMDVATIEVAGVGADGTTELRLRLVRADTYVVGDRRFPLEGSCQEMAETIATVIAAWETEPALSVAATKESPRTVAAAASPPPTTVAPTSVAYQVPMEIALGAGAGIAVIGGIAAAGNVELVFGRATSHWQLRLSVAGETNRHVELAPGQVNWHHTTAGAGLLWRLLATSWLLSLDAGPVAGWATLAGQGYTPDRKQTTFEYGIAGGVRAGRRLGRWSVWAEWRMNLWAQGQRARLTSAEGPVDSVSEDLSQVDMTVILGMSVLLFQ